MNSYHNWYCHERTTRQSLFTATSWTYPWIAFDTTICKIYPKDGFVSVHGIMHILGTGNKLKIDDALVLIWISIDEVEIFRVYKRSETGHPGASRVWIDPNKYQARGK